MSFRTYRRDVHPFETHTTGRLFVVDVSVNWPSGRNCQTKVLVLDSWKAAQLLLYVGCLKSQQHANASQGRICEDNFACCHTEIEVADPTHAHARTHARTYARTHAHTQRETRTQTVTRHFLVKPASETGRGDQPRNPTSPLLCYHVGRSKGKEEIANLPLPLLPPSPSPPPLPFSGSSRTIGLKNW